ncbi:hypothetical protein ACJX0J_026472, partial [Zea mays]
FQNNLCYGKLLYVLSLQHFLEYSVFINYGFGFLSSIFDHVASAMFCHILLPPHRFSTISCIHVPFFACMDHMNLQVFLILNLIIEESKEQTDIGTGFGRKISFL